MYVKTISYRSAFFFVWKLLFEINSYKQQTIRSNEAICLMPLGHALPRGSCPTAHSPFSQTTTTLLLRGVDVISKAQASTEPV